MHTSNHICVYLKSYIGIDVNHILVIIYVYVSKSYIGINVNHILGIIYVRMYGGPYVGQIYGNKLKPYIGNHICVFFKNIYGNKLKTYMYW